MNLPNFFPTSEQMNIPEPEWVLVCRSCQKTCGSALFYPETVENVVIKHTDTDV